MGGGRWLVGGRGWLVGMRGVLEVLMEQDRLE